MLSDTEKKNAGEMKHSLDISCRQFHRSVRKYNECQFGSYVSKTANK